MRTVAVTALLGGLITGGAGAQPLAGNTDLELHAARTVEAGEDASVLPVNRPFKGEAAEAEEGKPGIELLHDRMGLQDWRGAHLDYSRDPSSTKALTSNMRVWLPTGRLDGGFFGYIASGSAPNLPSTFSYLPQYAGANYLHWILNGPSSESVFEHSQAYGVGYGWRSLELERSASFGTARNQSKPSNDELIKFSSRSVRLSFKPTPNWLLGISRGSISGLDQLVPNGGERRTALSASYTQFFTDSIWQSTLGWGRSSRKFREATTGYLLDSMLKFNGGHIIFGRLEQVGSDELIRQEESLERQLFKIKKLTIGYSHNLRVSGSGPGNLDLGVMVSRYFTPAQMTSLYGDKPITYMMFVRLNLQ
ncbi:MAG TPA: hypothetical protein VJ654_18280 [Noviherbaspirillum sp.]|nr:hypothetical protein [Noviherbaspirillum sp.]